MPTLKPTMSSLCSACVLLSAITLLNGCGEVISSTSFSTEPTADRSTLIVDGNPKEVVVDADWSVHPDASCEENRHNTISLNLTAGPNWPETEQGPEYDLYLDLSFFFGGEQPPSMPVDIHSYDSRCAASGGIVWFYSETVPAGTESRVVGGEVHVDVEGPEDDLTFHARFVDLEIQSMDGSHLTLLSWDHTGPMSFFRSR